MSSPATSPAAPPVPDWVRTAICWQVYPLGFCGAPRQREDLVGEGYGGAEGENVVHRLPRLLGWLDHLVSLGANVLVLNPVFDAVSHGYDTLDHRRIDPRLGDEEDLEDLLAACRERGIRVVLDGVFNHVSAQHPVARRAIAAGPGTEEGALIRWSGEHPYGFEGNADLVELDLAHPVVQDRVVEVMGLWLDRGVDGWRLDALYAAGPEAWAPILTRVRAAHPEAWLLGEVIHGDYPAIADASGAHSITQYELWKAIWSSLRDGNLFELAHALGRHEQFLREAGGAHPLTFLGNHDTTRIASQLPDGRDLAPAIALLALLPGVPCVYAGDELGAVGVKEDRPGGDDAVRPAFPDDPASLLGGSDRADGDDGGGDPSPHQPHLLKAGAAPRILEAHRRLLGLRRREPWLATAHVAVVEASLENTAVEIVLSPSGGADGGDPGAGAPAPLRLVLNLGDEPRPAPGEILEAVDGAAMIDGVPSAGSGLVPAHGAAVLR